MMRIATGLAVSAIAVLAACNPHQGFCDKQYDCQDELKLELEDDYAEICAANAAGGDAGLRASTEDSCAALADAQLAWQTCVSALECEDFAKAVADREADTLCKEAGKELVQAEKDRGDCDGVK